MNICSLCGQYHGSAVCPMTFPQPTTAVPQPITAPATDNMTMTLNGVSLGEQQIIDRLDEIIKLLEAR